MNFRDAPPPLRSGLAAARHPFGDGLREAEAERPTHQPNLTLTETSNLSTN